MANIDNPIGFWAIRKLDGSPYNGQAAFAKLETSNTASFKGDPLALKASGLVEAAATDKPILGVAQGFEWVDASSGVHKSNYCPASTATASIEVTVNYVPAEDMVFGVQEDNSASTLALTHINNNADITVASGSTTTGLSAYELDSSDKKTGTAQCRILGLIKAPDNAIGSYAKWEIYFNERTTTTAAGV